MKLPAFSGFHSGRREAAAVVELARAVDIVECAGDLCNAHQYLERTVGVLSRITVPTVLVAGTNETTSELRDASADLPRFHVLHGNGVTIARVQFWGVGGGSTVTSFGAWNYDLAEDQAEPLSPDVRQVVFWWPTRRRSA